VEELHRSADLGGIAPDRGAVLVEDAGEPDALVHLSAREVPDVRVLGDDPERLALARATDPDRRAGPLERLRVRDGVDQAVVLAGERRPVLAPQKLDRAAGLLEPGDPLPGGAELQV